MANQTELLNVSDKMKLENDRQNLCEELSARELCSSSLDTFEELYSSSATDAYRMCCGFDKKIKVPISNSARKNGWYCVIARKLERS